MQGIQPQWSDSCWCIWFVCLAVIWEFDDGLLHTANLLSQKLQMQKAQNFQNSRELKKQIIDISSMQWSWTKIKTIKNPSPKMRHCWRSIPSPPWWHALLVQSDSDILHIDQLLWQFPLSQTQTHGIPLSMDQLPDAHLSPKKATQKVRNSG